MVAGVYLSTVDNYVDKLVNAVLNIESGKNGGDLSPKTQIKVSMNLFAFVFIERCCCSSGPSS